MTDELTRLKAAAIVKRLYSMAQNDDEMVTIWKEAAELILSLITRLESAEEALRPHACQCPGVCEREGDNAYASKDMCCIAHDALKSTPTNGL